MRRQLSERFTVLAMVLAGTLWISQAFAAVTTYNIPLNSAQEVPTNSSTATGAAYLEVNDVTRTVTYHITHNVVNQTAAHIHCCAPRGVNAGVIVTFPVGQGIKGVTAQLTAAQIASINAGQAYVNVHSSAFPGGEIRGQIDNISPSPGFNFCNAANCPGFSNTAFKVEIDEVPGTEVGSAPIPPGLPQGFLVLVEGGDAKNPLGWSDVVAFNVPPHPGVALLMSDASPRGVGDIEKSLRAAGYSSDQVLNSTTVYFKESRTGRLNVYQAGNAFYNVYSDPPARVPGLNPAGMAALFALLATAGTVLVWRRKAASEFAA